MKLYIDIETYSSVDLKSSGAYKYIESLDFEILLIAYIFDQEPVKIIDLAQGELLPPEFMEALKNPEVKKIAHNAAFERLAFKKIGYDVQWECTMIKAAYCGWPLSLEMVSKAMELEEKGKFATGRALIKYFCIPERHFPIDDPGKWKEFKEYCIQDVEAEREIDNRLLEYELPEFERLNYKLDQDINDRGILIDPVFTSKALEMDSQYSKKINTRLIELTKVENPNSAAQLKEWLSLAMNKPIKSLAKELIDPLIEEVDGCAALATIPVVGLGPSIAARAAISMGLANVKEVLQLRKKSSKTSIKKYVAMQHCTCEDGRAHGLFQFYGASRTGRWAGRLIQMQNLPQNHLNDIDLDRQVVRSGNYDLVSLMYDDISSLLSQLIRTAFIAKKNHTFAIADFSAIEARVLAWLAGEDWRMKVFASHGKIYEASAVRMFKVPIEEVTKESDIRFKAKTAELALGYQGSLGAFQKLGGKQLGLSDTEMTSIVKRWRAANPAIVKFWHNIEKCAKQAVKGRTRIPYKGLTFTCDKQVLRIQLPSGRELFYQQPGFTINKFHQPSIRYKGMDQVTKQWWWVDTYGGKLVENIVQAIARDLLAAAMLRINRAGFNIVMHVHDEVVCEIKNYKTEDQLKKLCNIMSQGISWTKNLPLAADGYLTSFYKK